MPQRRTQLQSTPAFTVERVDSFVPVCRTSQWSPVYQVASCRFILPHSGLTEFRWGDSFALLDGISVLCLPTGLPYQMQQFHSGLGEATSNIVISLPADSAATVSQPRTVALNARAQWQLRRHWRELALRNQSEPSTAVRHILDLTLPLPLTSGSLSSARCIHSVKRDIARRVASLDAPRWTLHDVADSAGLSPFYLARIFKAHTGMTLHGYRQQLRLTMALQCLQGSKPHCQVNLADLAAGLGYSSQSHMGFAFQRELGVTPAQARLELAG